MGKTLAVIINHNRKEYTDRLFTSLKPYENTGNYDLIVFDNGSNDADEVSEYTTFKTDENSYYGGALNIIFSVMLENTQYDSVLVFNNDVILHPYNFIRSMREVMFEQQYHIVSPSVLQPETIQCTWRQMHNWSSPTPRNVRWVDFMCPLIHRDVVEHIEQYDNNLIYGWGQDVYTGIVCEQKNWKLAVMDTNSVIHLSSQTFKDNKSNISISEYGQLATNGMVQFFNNTGLLPKMQEFREWGHRYTHA